jgi:Fe-S-cluster containining protein
MNPDNAPQGETVTAHVTLAGESWELQTAVSVPTGPIQLRTMLPMVQSFADAVVGVAAKTAEEQGRRISCRKGCGACCRQLVPISEVEARHLAALVEAMPEPRRSRIQARFIEAGRRLAEAGLLEVLRHRQEWAEGQGRSVGSTYFQQGIPCPFLEEEACSIHPDRPIACREYLVTSPAENCARPSAETVDCVKLPMRLWPALALFDAVGPEERFIRWVPLVLAPEWVAAHPEEPDAQPGPELLRRFFDQLTAQKRVPWPPEDAGEDASCPQTP